jgi:hypothetical protein
MREPGQVRVGQRWNLQDWVRDAQCSPSLIGARTDLPRSFRDVPRASNRSSFEHPKINSSPNRSSKINSTPTPLKRGQINSSPNKSRGQELTQINSTPRCGVELIRAACLTIGPIRHQKRKERVEILLIFTTTQDRLTRNLFHSLTRYGVEIQLRHQIGGHKLIRHQTIRHQIRCHPASSPVQPLADRGTQRRKARQPFM